MNRRLEKSVYGTDELANRIRQALQNPHSDSFSQALQVRKRRVLERVVRVMTMLGFCSRRLWLAVPE
jgi:hypothetical protein